MRDVSGVAKHAPAAIKASAPGRPAAWRHVARASRLCCPPPTCADFSSRQAMAPTSTSLWYASCREGGLHSRVMPGTCLPAGRAAKKFPRPHRHPGMRANASALAWRRPQPACVTSVYARMSLYMRSG